MAVGNPATVEVSFSSWVLNLAVFGLGDRVAEEVIEEEGVVSKVAFEESAGFHGEAVCPFHADFLEKSWRLFYLAGVEGKGGADAKVDTWRELIFVARDPVFLFRAAEADPDEVGSAAADFFANFGELVGRPFAEGRRVGSSDDRIGEAFVEGSGELVEGRLFATEEEVAELGEASGGFERFEHQRWAIDTVGDFFRIGELSIDRPDEGHAIGADQVEAGHARTEIRIMPRECCDMGVGGFDRVGSIGFGSVFEDP